MLSIVFVNYKTSKDIQKCLDSIEKYEKNYKKYEYIIVDNNSEDKGLDQLKKKFPYIKLIYASDNGGFAYGNNIGIKQAKGDTIFLLNPDTYLTDNSIEKLYERLNNDDSVHLIGPKLLFEDKTNQSYYLPKSYPTIWRIFCEQFYLYRIFKKSKIFNSYFRTYMDYDKESCVEQISGAALMFKAEILKKVGLMDDKYFMFFEESDFCLQAVRNNYKMLYYPQSQIIHIGGFINESSWERSIKDTVKSFKYYFGKNYNSLYKFFALYILLSSSLLKAFLFMLTGNKKYRFFMLHVKNIFKKQN